MDQELHVTIASYEDKMSYYVDQELNVSIASYEDEIYLRNIKDTVALVSIVIDWISLGIELPLICWAIFVLYHQVKGDNVAPIYVINLLISDIIQIIGRVGVFMKHHVELKVPFWMEFHIFFFGVLASGVFMLCIALERYMVIVHPLWYRFRRTIKHSVLISLAAWVGSVLITVLRYNVWRGFASWGISLIIVIITLLPFPLLVFFLVATWRALSRCISVAVPEKKRILRILVLVLGNYTVIFLPTIFESVYEIIVPSDHFGILVFETVVNWLLYISPMMDILLYILLRKDAITPSCGRLICCQESREIPSPGIEIDTRV